MLGTSARLLRLLTLLQTRRSWTGPELCAKLEVDVADPPPRRRSAAQPRLPRRLDLRRGWRLPPGRGQRAAAAPARRRGGAGRLARVAHRRGRQRQRDGGGRRCARSPSWNRCCRRACGWRLSALHVVDHRPLARRRRPTVDAHTLATIDRRVPRPPRGWRFDGDRARRDVLPTPARPKGAWRAYVSRSVSLAPYPVRARVLLHAPIADMARKVSPTAGTLESVDARSCLLHAGAPSLDALAVWMSLLGVEFEVRDPPEARAHLRAYGRARAPRRRSGPAAPVGDPLEQPLGAARCWRRARDRPRRARR